MLLCMVATNSTFTLDAPIFKFGTYKGCAKTVPSTGKEYNLPNVFTFTFDGVRTGSVIFAAVLKLLY